MKMKRYIYDNPAMEDEEYSGYSNDFLFENGFDFSGKNMKSILLD